jgi:hypothetical protein
MTIAMVKWTKEGCALRMGEREEVVVPTLLRRPVDLPEAATMLERIAVPSLTPPNPLHHPSPLHQIQTIIP